MTNSSQTLNGFCDDPIWDTSLTWEGPWPQFTNCFQWTVLVWVPCGFLWLAAPFYITFLASLLHMPSSRQPLSTLFLSKVSLMSMALVLTTVDTINVISVREGSDFVNAQVFAPLTLTLSVVLALVITLIEKLKHLVTSGVLFIFWFLLCVSRVVPLYTAIELKAYEQDWFSFSLLCLELASFLGLFVTQFFTEKCIHMISESQLPCPELKASFPSRLSFSWVNWLLRMGYRATLTELSLRSLRPADKCQTVINRFLPKWTTSLQTARRKQAQKRCSENSQPVTITREASEKTPLLSAEVTANRSQASISKISIQGISYDGNSKQKPGDCDVQILQPSQSSKSEKENSSRLTSPSLIWVLARTFWSDFLLSQVWKLFYDVLILCNPLLLGQLVDYVEQQTSAVWKGYVLAVSLFLSMMLQSVFFHQVFHLTNSLALKIRATLISSVFRKALTMNNLARQKSTQGEVVNLMSVDAEHVQECITYIWAIWSSPLQIGVSLYLLYATLGVSMFAGAAFLVLLIPANGFVTAMLGRYQTEIMQFKDERMKLMNEMLAGMKIVKFFAWEKSFEEKILKVRNKELKRLLQSGLLLSIVNFSWTSAPFLTSLLTYLCYVYISPDHYLDPKTAFVAIALFNILRFAMNFLPSILTDLTKAIISLRRISKFLRHDDLDKDNVTRNQINSHAISVTNATFRWNSETETTLKSINMQVEDDSLVAIVGPVGCGKSSLVSALLGEMEKLKGSVNIRGSVAYVPQQAWIQNDTLQNNILFGRPMNYNLYQKCIDGCALRPDLDILPAGDLTEIGEKGINLSGGQKQRVSLARALYAQADVYLLDDPLSAVDGHVGRHIFDNVIGDGGLLTGKVRVLVTHGIHYLPSTDHIVVMDGGVITESGHYDKLLSHNGPFARLISSFLKQDTAQDKDSRDDDAIQSLKQDLLRRLSETEEDDGCDSQAEGSSSQIIRQLSRSVSKMSELSQDSKHLEEEQLIKRQQSQIGNITEEERVEIGQVNWKVFSGYLRSVGIFYCILMTGAYIFYGGFTMGGHIFLSTWTDDDDLANFTLWPANSTERKDANDYYIGIYGMFGGLQTIFVTIFSILESVRLVAASRSLHCSMLRSILRAPMSFFDTTPTGRIINRFSKDLDEMDQELPMTFVMWIDTIINIAITLIVISYSTPIFLAFVLPIGIVYTFVQRYFIATSRQLKRLSSKTVSPIFNHFSESLNGASVIRAFGVERRFVLESEAKVDKNQEFMFYNYCINRWLGFNLETVGNLVILVAASIAVASSDSISSGIMGLSITYALNITGDMNWLVRMTSDLETQIVSVERILGYTNIDSEACWESDVCHSPPGWPRLGGIRVEDLSLRYRSGLDLVLRGISFEVKPGEKVGIVGRTGAGKSSLTLALFRLVEAATGRIFIDDINIANLGLHDLRSKITILPQDPVMFAGTLRSNLDPFSQFSDEAIWTGLEHAHLKKFVDGLPSGLDHQCGEGGENLSVGQRQLVCLARALLHKTKILVLDEATAAVDMETDELIQNTIRSEFSDCTILTIAHRLNTVLDYDRILVLDKGQLKEFDTPSALLDNPHSLFFDMAKAAGLA